MLTVRKEEGRSANCPHERLNFLTVVALLSLDVDDASQCRHNVLGLCKVYGERFYDTDWQQRSSSKLVDTAEYLNSSSSRIMCCAIASEWLLTMIELFEGSYHYFTPSFNFQPSSMESLQEPGLVICRLFNRNKASTAKIADSSSLHSLWLVSAMCVVPLF